MKSVTLEIDGKKIEAEPGTTILDAATDNNIQIPTLCYNRQLKPYGACRMCMVEITRNNRTRLVASCVYPVEDNLVVKTQTEKLTKIRRMIMELLSPCVHSSGLLGQYAVKEPRFKGENRDCSLCGLCVRYCAQVGKTNAVYFLKRGIDRQVGVLPEKAADCIYCGKCFGLCSGGRIVDLGNSAFE